MNSCAANVPTRATRIWKSFTAFCTRNPSPGVTTAGPAARACRSHSQGNECRIESAFFNGRGTGRSAKSVRGRACGAVSLATFVAAGGGSERSDPRFRCAARRRKRVNHGTGDSEDSRQHSARANPLLDQAFNASWRCVGAGCGCGVLVAEQSQSTESAKRGERRSLGSRTGADAECGQYSAGNSRFRNRSVRTARSSGRRHRARRFEHSPNFDGRKTNGEGRVSGARCKTAGKARGSRNHASPRAGSASTTVAATSSTARHRYQSRSEFLTWHACCLAL